MTDNSGTTAGWNFNGDTGGGGSGAPFINTTTFEPVLESIIIVPQNAKNFPAIDFNGKNRFYDADGFTAAGAISNQ